MSRLGAVALLVPDYDEAIAVSRALDWRVEEDEDQWRKRWVTVAGGEARILLARAEGAEQMAAIGAQFGGRVGLFLRSDDFAGDARRIEAAGGTFEEAPRVEPYGTVAVWRDPWGNRWDLIEPA
ncbi:VOC family protein [Jannaschia sp. S6380]|uniref:VOC family protein n=1 Tax=Jannaschia sp. S6380 TaxID=2926408 RepID=UPI001FF356D4|nr:VOC family protein [Jannaschia sp. S6380]MCK0169308.1 VOC family protein [Jannaschia sp. S6380]